MSGGQRQFRDDPYSYEKTGIPCGNPMRYDSRGVIRMGQSDRPYKDLRLAAPMEDIETEGERQLKALVKRQLEKDVTVAGQLSRKKQFHTANMQKPLTAEVSGSVSLKEYQGLESHDRRLEELQQYGLTEDEIKLTLEAEGVGLDGRPAKRSRYGADPVTITAKLESIQRKISKKREELAKPDNFSGTRYMSRHEMDLERAISHNRDKTRLLGMLMTTDRPGLHSEDPNDPINQLENILEEVQEKAKKSRTIEESSDSGSELLDSGVASCSNKPSGYISQNSIPVGDLCPLCRLSIPNMPHKGDFDEPHEVEKVCCNCNQIFRNPNVKNSTEMKNTPKGKFTKDPKVKVATTPSVYKPTESIPEEVINRYKLPIEEIRKLPRFKDYSPGDPSKVLYLKNLSAKVTEDDLVSLFVRFQKPNQPKIDFRLMNGRMRGQAFVTFDSEETAKHALELVNGYDFRGKPIIIQYGRK